MPKAENKILKGARQALAIARGDPTHPGSVTMTPDELAATVQRIVALHRQRQFAIEQTKRGDNATAALVRTILGYSLAMPAAERNAVVKRARAIIDACEADAKGKPHDCADPAFELVADSVMAWIGSRDGTWKQLRKQTEKQMEAIVTELPIWQDCDAVRGFGAMGLASLIGEAPGPDNLGPGAYDTPLKLRKRMGLSVLDGIRQGGLPKSAPKEAWIAHGYSRRRRSIMWNVGQALVKAGGSWCEVYRERKADARAKAEALGLTVKPAGEIRKKEQAACISLGHIDRRGQRGMERRFLVWFWRRWRKVMLDRPESLPMAAE